MTRAETKLDKTCWAISRLRLLPEQLFYSSVISMTFGHGTVSNTARIILNSPNRGELQNATFHTLRTYLTPVHKLWLRWLSQALAGGRPFPPVPEIFREAELWYEINR